MMCTSFFVISLLSLTALGNEQLDVRTAIPVNAFLDQESEVGENCSVLLLQDKVDLSGADKQASEKVSQSLTASGLSPPASNVIFSACAAEFIAMILFIVIGCGSAMGIAKQAGSAWILQVSLTFGLAITALAYAIGHYSGGQINCAVTLGLVIAGQLNIVQGIFNFIAQMLGSLVGAWMLTMIYPEDKDLTGGLASNSVSPNHTWFGALVGEILMTFLLVYVVLETATNPDSAANRQLAPLAIGVAVFLAHSVLIPIDGCSINPTRSFGPEIMARIRYGKGSSDHAVFWAGPLIGAAVAAGIYSAMSL